MSSPNTFRYFGTSKNYGRARENATSRSFDDMMKGKAAPNKASAGHTKWGVTNYVAVRDNKKSKLEARQGSQSVTTPEDPFSFDTDDRGKTSPVKPQSSPFAPEAQRSATRLPASRIVTQGARHAATASGNVSPQDNPSPQAIARPGRTYTHSQEGRLSTGRSTQLLLDRFVEVGNTVNNGSVCSAPDRQFSRVTEHAPSHYGLGALGTSPKKPVVVPSSSSWHVYDDYNRDIFHNSNSKSYSGEVITPISTNTADGSPVVKRRQELSGLPYQYKPKGFSEPVQAEDRRSQYKEFPRQAEPTARTISNTVISRSRVEMCGNTDDVQTRYHNTIKRGPDKPKEPWQPSGHLSRPWEVDMTDLSAGAESSSRTSSSLARSSSSSQGSNSTRSSPLSLQRMGSADKQTVSSASDTYSKYVLSRKTHPTSRASSSAREKSARQSSQVSASSISSVKTAFTSSNSSSSSSSVTRGGGTAQTSQMRSGAKQYRIFKSRRVPQAVSEEPVSVKEEEDVVPAGSPPMPELTLEVEVSDPCDSAESDYDSQHPPSLTDPEGTETTAESSQNDVVTVSNSQVSQQSEDVSERLEKPVEDSRQEKPMEDSLSPSPSPLVLPSDSQDTLSVGTDDDSQELSQEIVISSTTESSQKEESAPAPPRRFFKSKKSSSASNLQRKMLKKSPSKALYNARSWHQDENTADKYDEAPPPPVKRAKTDIPFFDDEEFSFESPKAPKLIRSVHWPSDREQEAYTSVQVNTQHKQLYTVVHNVKMAHEVQESGETQDFIDDIEYLLDNLKDNQSISIRSLSTVQLAGKCTLPAFRMHLRAHGIVTKIFSLLHDACSHPSLALSTAAMMFMLSRDRLNMDLDKESLNLMLKLNEVDMPRSHTAHSLEGGEGEEEGEGEGGTSEDSGELEKCRTRIQDMLRQLEKEANAKKIDLDFVSTGNLAMECLLSLTSRRAGEWFKEELRKLGGLDHFVETIHHCGMSLKEDLPSNLFKYTPSLKKLDRFLRVLENITFMNSDNQAYLIAYNKGLLITAAGRILQQCVDCLLAVPLQEVVNGLAVKDQAGWIVFECLLAVLRVLLNITHDCEFGSTRVGEEKGLLHAVLQCVASTQWCVPTDHRFDLLVLSLGLLVNMMEHCPVNRRQLVGSTLTGQITEYDDPTEMGAVQALVQLFLERERAARQIEEAPETPVKKNDTLDRSGEWHESESGIQWLTRSAEKVKAAEEDEAETGRDGTQEIGSQARATAEGETGGDKPTDGTSILEEEDTFTKALHKAGKHMENNIVASYVGLLLGCLIQDNRKYASIVRDHLPEGSFDSMIKILKKFLGFMNLTTAIGTTDANSIQRVIDTLEAC